MRENGGSHLKVFLPVPVQFVPPLKEANDGALPAPRGPHNGRCLACRYPQVNAREDLDIRPRGVREVDVCEDDVAVRRNRLWRLLPFGERGGQVYGCEEGGCGKGGAEDGG